MSPIEQKILNFLAQNPGSSVVDLKEKIGVHPKTFSNFVRRSPHNYVREKVIEGGHWFFIYSQGDCIPVAKEATKVVCADPLLMAFYPELCAAAERRDNATI